MYDAHTSVHAQESARQDEEARARATTWRLAPAASEPRLPSVVEYARLGGGVRALSVGEFPDAVLPQAQRQPPRPVSAGHMHMQVRVDVPSVWTDLVARREPVTAREPRASSSSARLARGARRTQTASGC